MHTVVIRSLRLACRCRAGDRVRSAHIEGGRALVRALQDGQAGGQPLVHLLVGGQGLRVLRLQPGHRYCLLGQLSKEVGWNYTDTIRMFGMAEKEMEYQVELFNRRIWG
ncbi:uncharacterized protein [Aegilops tauschii subsp. strangulata]|uniref:uncharacterized protein n=1 Tax=Aegilops tauschii subsp. strangulata TaxID=200361 RepID=UPI003CC8E04B